MILFRNSNLISQETHQKISLMANRLANLRIPVTFLLTAKIVLGGISIACENPIVNKVNISLSRLPMQQFRIIQLSDLHVGISVGKSRVEKTVQIVNDLCDYNKYGKDNACDLIVLTGDLIDGDPRHLIKGLKPLQKLGSSKIPKIFVPGNHEHLHYNVDDVVKVLSEIGITSLVNDNTRLPKGKSRKNQLIVVGLDDISCRKSRGKTEEAFDDTIPGKDTII